MDGGIMKRHRNTKRWVCYLCVTRKSHSIYRNQPTIKANFSELSENPQAD